MNKPTDAESDSDIAPSKSQIKREFHALQALGKELVELPDKHLQLMPLSEALSDAVHEARSMKFGALKRQLKYIGGLMPTEDLPAIRAALEDLKHNKKKEVDAFHETEQWRDRLLRGDQDLINELASRYTLFERQHVSQLVRNAKKEQQQGKAPKSARLLFSYLQVLKDS